LGTPSNQALLDVTATASVNPFVSASGVLSPGIYELESNAVLEYSGPGISSISNGAAVQILGPYGASITDTSLTPLTSRGVNSALDTLSSNAGNLLLDSTAVDTSGNLVNSGSMEVTESGTCAPNSFGGCTIAYPPASLNVAGTLTNTNPSGAASQNGVHGIGISSGATVSAGGLVNSGSMDITGFNSAAAVSSLASSGPATNSGTIYVLSGGQLTAAGALTNTDTGVLFLGRGSAVYNGSSYTPVATAVSAGGFDNAGAVNISGGNGSSQPGATLTITGSGNSYTQTAPLAVTTVGGTLVAQAVNIQGGLLQGNGTINGDVTNAATVVAMNSAYPYFITPSVLTVSGNYTQTSSGVLDELIQGSVTRGAQYNAINVSGSVTLAGALDVTTLNGFTLAANQSYDLMNFTPGALTGTFGTLQYNNIAASAGGTGLLNLGNQLALSINYDNSTGEVVLDVVTAQPAPTSDGWIGNTDNWSNPVDWSTGQTPLPSQDVTVGTGSGGTVAYNEAASTVNSLTVESGSGNGGTYALTFGGNDALNVTKTVSISTPSTPSGSSLELMASGATLSTGGNLTIYSGGLYVANGGAVTVGAQGAPADLINDSSLYVDAGCAACQGTAASTGGGNLTVSGTLTNNGDLRIGNGGSITSPGGITTQSMVSAQSLSATSGATTLANTLSGNVLIAGENPAFGSAPAVVRLGTSITSIEPPPGGAGSLTLMNANSFITTDTSGPYTNDGISALANIGAGATLSLDAGASATIGTSLTNAGAISLVTQFNNGSTSAPYVSDLPTTLTVAGLSNSGAISLTGCLTSGCTAPALLDITGPSGSFIPADGSLSAGNYQLAGNAELEYNGPGISSIGHGVYLTLAGQNGAIPSISVMNNGVTGSAFGTLTGNAGYLAFSGGASITTSVGLTNTGIMSLSSGSGQPPTS
ncbi:MAG: beta strand repeat-containing protein, partial [Acidimicrobiales bacterium]